MLPKDKSATTFSKSSISKPTSQPASRATAKRKGAATAKPSSGGTGATAAGQPKSAGAPGRNAAGAPGKEGLEAPVQFVKGVGPRLGAVFASRGVGSIRELLTFFPRAYEDRSRFLKVSELVDGQSATVSVMVTGSRRVPTRMGRSFFEVRCADASGSLGFKYFHMPRGMEHRFGRGVHLIATGTVKMFMGRPEMIHPEITWGMSADTSGAATPSTVAAPGPTTRDEESSAGDPNHGRVVPVYTEIEGVPTRALRKILWEAVERYANQLSEDLPLYLREKHRLPTLSAAVRDIHFPEGTGGDSAAAAEKIANLIAFNTPSHHRLIYEEFFKFEYLILRRKLRMQRETAAPIGHAGGRAATAALEAALPFKLTGDQRRVIADILSDLAQSHPMNRLIQGDVGSGKTAVAFLSAGAVLAEGGQAALMAPTEILAEQHYKNAVKFFGGRLNVGLLTGKTTGAERAKLLGRLKGGEPMMLIGTHALIEDPVEFANLLYVMIDEQHRFGVEQRRALRNKGKAGPRGLQPHSLILTATPIPRTLALTAYGDLTVSSIKEMPPGRSPVITKVIQGDARGLAYERIHDELKRGKQAYFIYPLVNESEAEGFTALKSAVVEAERLQHEVFPQHRVAILHGQMRPDEKARVMDEFKRGEITVLVSTTVVEVGVDVPNATIMVVEHAERFGLSQLHQLRGRVGRGSEQSYCFFFTHPKVGETTQARLEVLEETHDGFKIAEADLEIRGPGEFLGTRQAGGLPFRLADLVRDKEWLVRAREDAETLLQTDRDLERAENLPVRRYFEKEGVLRAEILRTS